jgi:hypothetical protein
VLVIDCRNVHVNVATVVSIGKKKKTYLPASDAANGRSKANTQTRKQGDVIARDSGVVNKTSDDDKSF